MNTSTAQVIELELEQNSYNITVDFGLKNRLADVLSSWNQGQQWVVLTQQAIFDFYTPVIEQLKIEGYRIETIIVPADESAKDIRHAEAVWAQMVEAGCDRSSVLLALGGGVVGDLGGFVAATYMRGILVGAIYQPKAVLIDPDFLATLPRRNVISSLAEAIKYGFIRDKSIFDTFESRFEDLVSLEDKALLSEIIAKSCAIKAQIVSNDQFENGERRLLNYGHTIGHAFETIQAYGGLYHGEAVL